MTEQKAVIDRIVDGQHAVLLVGEEETEFIVPREQLPTDAHEGVWLRVRLEDGMLVEAVLDSDQTEQTRQRISSKLDQLRARGRKL